MIPDRAATVWEQIRKWAAAGAGDEQKARLRERIRRYAFTVRGRHLSGETKDHAREIYDLLAPRDPVCDQWLFAQHWVEELADEIAAEKFDYQRREERIGKLRAAAIAEIWKTSGYDGILGLCTSGEASYVVGWQIAAGAVKRLNAADFVYRLASEPAAQVDGCLAGFLTKTEDAKREELLETLMARFGSEGERVLQDRSRS